MNYYMFGAHSRAKTTSEYLLELDKDLSLKAYLYDNDEKNPDEIDGVPVLDIRRTGELITSLPVYIGTRGVFHQSITEHLKQKGFSDIRPVTVSLDQELRNEYMRRKIEGMGKEFKKIDDIKGGGEPEKTKARIYEVRSIFDKPLTVNKPHVYPYESTLQVGTALTEDRINGCSLYDDSEENISGLNRQMCELTALYWFWKNAGEDYQGLVHYRRHFLLPDDWLSRLISNDIDVVLPVPMCLKPSVEEDFKFRHPAHIWGILMQVLKKRSKDDYYAAKECFSDTLFFPCNMFIMKREHLERYCGWLFPILFSVKDQAGILQDTYQNRYPAFIAERLLTLYCYIHSGSLRIVFADKNFLS